MANVDQQRPRVIQWLVDTRPLWPEAKETKELEQQAQRPLSLLAPSEVSKVLDFYFVRDAKTALASHLLKRLAVHVGLHVPWEQCSIVPNPEDKNGKPVYVSAPDEGKVWFNVSHQAGIVALVAVVVPPDSKFVGVMGNVDVGVDVVCTSERRNRDRKMISGNEDGSTDGNGWKKFIDMHADVFSKGEVAYLESGLGLPLGSHGRAKANGEPQLDSIDTRLRYFYALWCLREAYVKMTGEALLAPWLGELEFKNFVPPPACPSISDVAVGQTVFSDVGPPLTDHEIFFRGARVTDAQVSLCALGTEYMLCTAVRTKADPALGLGLDLRSWTILSMDEIVTLAS